MSKFIVTYTPCFKEVMLREICKVDPNIRVANVLSESHLIIESSLEQKNFINKLLLLNPIFPKHIMPVISEGEINGDLEKDKIKLLDNSKELVKNDLGKYSVQCRIISGGDYGLPYSSKDIEVYVGRYYEINGAQPVFSDYSLKNEEVDIISILINKNHYYMGVSTTTENLNFNCDEYRICSKRGREISRAENKLKEALVKFKISLNGEGNALDIGAAPGGWTKVLADYGYYVTAVDPGMLKPELENDPRINHLRCRIEELTFDNYFNIITNDMNVDPSVTASIMNNLSPTLQDNGLAIVTIKLPDEFEKGIQEASEIMNEKYDVLSIKSLFHNRQEVTSLIKKKQLIR